MPDTVVTMALTVWRQGPDRKLPRLRELVRSYAKADGYKLDPGLLEEEAVKRAAPNKGNTP